ncbi:hypothetical protein ASE26_05170 [Duganella sp. Root198D2]|nr:hypothetical protein ASE26_05170 [Duganella sp. Root198D2]
MKGIGQIRPDAGGHDLLADIGDFVEVQPAGSLEHKLVAYQLDESVVGGRATRIHMVQRL